jgi:hypothetical protein
MEKEYQVVTSPIVALKHTIMIWDHMGKEKTYKSDSAKHLFIERYANNHDCPCCGYTGKCYYTGPLTTCCDCPMEDWGTKDYSDYSDLFCENNDSLYEIWKNFDPSDIEYSSACFAVSDLAQQYLNYWLAMKEMNLA